MRLLHIVSFFLFVVILGYLFSQVNLTFKDLVKYACINGKWGTTQARQARALQMVGVAGASREAIMTFDNHVSQSCDCGAQLLDRGDWGIIDKIDILSDIYFHGAPRDETVGQFYVKVVLDCIYEKIQQSSKTEINNQILETDSTPKNTTPVSQPLSVSTVIPFSDVQQPHDTGSQKQMDKDYENGRAAANRGDFKAAFDKWRSLANVGYAKAQYSMGRLYARGDGVQKDYQEAAYWFGEAAKQGLAEAQFKLGRMYEVGDGIPRSFEESERLYRLASAQGHLDATAHLQKLTSQMTGTKKAENVAPQKGMRSKESSGCNLSVAGIESTKDFVAFLERLRTAVLTNNREELAALVSYPLHNIVIQKKSRRIYSAEAFLEHYDEIVNKDVQEAIVSQKLENLFCKWSGVMLGDGEVWVGPVEGGDIKITQIHNGEAEATPFLCITNKFIVEVSPAGRGDFVYKSWIKPKDKTAKPDLILGKGVHHLEGTGPCAHGYWSFSSGAYMYKVGTLGCTEEKTPTRAVGFLEVLKNDVALTYQFCME